MSKQTYDAKADAIAVRFAPDGTRPVESEQVAPAPVLDYDEHGQAGGVELLNVQAPIAAKSNAA